MATIKWGDKETELVEDWRVGELIEAENALGIDMNEAKGAAQIALVVYISRRRVEPELPSGILADQVMRMELSALAADEEAAGPLGEEDEASGVEENGAAQITGRLPLANSG